MSTVVSYNEPISTVLSYVDTVSPILYIILYCTVACIATMMLVKLIRDYRKSVWNKITFALWCFWVILWLLCAIQFWIVSFTRIVLYMQ